MWPEKVNSNRWIGEEQNLNQFSFPGFSQVSPVWAQCNLKPGNGQQDRQRLQEKPSASSLWRKGDLLILSGVGDVSPVYFSFSIMSQDPSNAVMAKEVAASAVAVGLCRSLKLRERNLWGHCPKGLVFKFSIAV